MSIYRDQKEFGFHNSSAEYLQKRDELRAEISRLKKEWNMNAKQLFQYLFGFEIKNSNASKWNCLMNRPDTFLKNYSDKIPMDAGIFIYDLGIYERLKELEYLAKNKTVLGCMKQLFTNKGSFTKEEVEEIYGRKIKLGTFNNFKRFFQ